MNKQEKRKDGKIASRENEITINDGIKYVTEAAKQEGQVCFLYRVRGEYFASFEYWDDWIFKAYPGGRRILRPTSIKSKGADSKEEAKSIERNDDGR